MLARSAEGLYWLGRYQVRAEQLGRLLQMQVQALVDRPVPEIHFGWRRLYTCVGDPFLEGGFEEYESEEFALADAYALAEYLTLERNSDVSLYSCLAAARENARQTRTCISGEMWTCINLSYMRLRDTAMHKIWAAQPEGYYDSVLLDMHALTGVTRATMYRDRGWSFLTAGRQIERAQQLVALLRAHFMAEPDDAGLQGAGRASLLRIFKALDAYQQRHGIEVRADWLLDLLVTDPLLPRSLRRALEGVKGALAGVGEAPQPLRAKDVAEQAVSLLRLLADDWSQSEDKQATLAKAAEGLRTIHVNLSQTWFHHDAGAS